MYNYNGELMVETVVTVRKWGNSIGTTIPPEIIEKEKIRPNDKIVLSVRKITPFQKLFGTWKTKKTAQQIKDEIKKGWE